MLVYGLSRPDKNGDAPALTKWIASWANQAEEWERINTKHTATVEQAARDKHLFFNVEANPHIELKFPEYAFPRLQNPPPEASSAGLASLPLTLWQAVPNWLSVQCPSRTLG